MYSSLDAVPVGTVGESAKLEADMLAQTFLLTLIVPRSSTTGGSGAVGNVEYA
jgi:hypothetical protein